MEEHNIKPAKEILNNNYSPSSKEEFWQFVLENIVDVNSGNTPLHTACINGQLDIVKTLVEKGDNIDAQNIHGNTPLHMAALTDRVEIIRFLNRKGADLNKKNNKQKTALDILILQSRHKVLN